MNRSGLRDGAPPGVRIAAVLCALWLGGCEWVDSAGNDDDGASDDPVGPVQVITLDEQPLNGATAVRENGTARLAVSRGGDPSRELRFESDVLDSGALDTCLAIEGFDAGVAADSLEAACSDGETDCAVVTGRDDSDEELGITLRVPAIRAPVGLRFQLAFGRSVEGVDGEPVFVEDDLRQIDLCLLNINDPPSAAADSYVVLETQTLEVDAQQGVLANDTDDQDVGNLPLSATLEDAPMRAALFALRPDGSFNYVPAADDGGADVLDTFSYRASDGSNASDVATVTIRSVTANQAPRASQPLPPIVARAGTFLSFDFTEYFVDPEEGPLTFAFVEPLPNAGSLSLGRDGSLVGVADPDDVGDYPLTLVVSDGDAQISEPVNLRILAGTPEPPPAENAAPVFLEGSVFDQTIRLGQAIVPVRARFEDPDGDVLSFRLGGTTRLSPGLTLDAATGTVSGRPRQRRVLEGLVIEASDPDGQTALSAAFTIRIE